jgi:hypothetical protein
MYDRIIVRLPTEYARRALVDVAEREFRDPRDQAAYYVVRGLQADGALPVAEHGTSDHRLPTTVEAGK